MDFKIKTKPVQFFLKTEKKLWKYNFKRKNCTFASFIFVLKQLLFIWK